MILFYVGHPAHFHNVKNLVSELESLGQKVIFVVRPKDVLLNLISESGYRYHTLSPKSGSGFVSVLVDLVNRTLKILGLAKNERVKVLVGTDPTITYVAKFTGSKSIVLNEDDAEAVPKFAALAYPFADKILVPDCCSTGRYEKRTIRYSGYHELAYLSPSVFEPKWEKVSAYLSEQKGYVIFRFSSLNAHHDVGVGGIDDVFALQMIDMIKDRYQVIITSERPLSEALEPYRQSFDPALMHDVLAYAKLIIGDSQTMAAEAMVLGTPSIRCNDFVGRLSYLEELEKHYELGFSVLPENKAKILELIPRILDDQNFERTWDQRKNKMLSEKIDVVQFWKREILKSLAEA